MVALGGVETNHNGGGGDDSEGTRRCSLFQLMQWLLKCAYLSSSNLTPKILALYYMQITPPYNQLLLKTLKNLVYFYKLQL